MSELTEAMCGARKIKLIEALDSTNVIGGTYLQGGIKASFTDLVEAFGPPLRGDGYKTRAEWVLEFCVPQDGDEPDEEVIATIYDWKRFNQELISVTDWNVGGYTIAALNAVRKYLKDREETV